MPTVQELYELWAGESELQDDLQRSLEPRGADLLRLARLRRCEDALAERYGPEPVAAATGGLLWGIYQLLGKLCPTVYVWQRDG
jgi:hypothetical protein